MEIEEPIRVRELLDQAMSLSGAERQEFLSRSCASDDSLRRRVEELIAALERADDFLVEPQFTGEAPTEAMPGDVIGRYRLAERIGEGGMGVVYKAEQKHPIRREVALKIVKAGMDSRQVVARFRAERQALALMDHPNIARVIDAGTTDTGRPYFVMELVSGVPITHFCDHHKLRVLERLELFRTVCSAVHHAHQKGVIHRDIKPSNILVAMQDGGPVAKVIDFGVAKATRGRLTDQTLYTGLRQMIGTPAYMSPEQARAFADGGADVDTRSDVYSLGVVLYELLTGTTPFDAKTLQRAALEQLLRVITEQEPPRPSTRLGSLDEGTRLQTAQARREEPGRLSRTVRGDLDWIVLRCLEKDRGRRYGSASALADDVERFLREEPVEARRPTRGYRLRKFLRRHRVGVTMAVGCILVLLVSLVLASTGYYRAARQARIARAERTRSEQVAAFLTDTLRAAGPGVARGRDATLLREILATTAKRLDTELSNEPEVRGDLWMTLGRTHADIGDRVAAITDYQKAADSYRAAVGESHIKLAQALARLGAMEATRNNMGPAFAHAEQALRIARAQGDPDTLAVCLTARGQVCAPWGTGSTRAVPYHQEALAVWQKLGNRQRVATSMRLIATCLDDDDPQKESYARQALQTAQELLSPDDPSLMGFRFVLAQVLLDKGKLQEAEPVLRDCYAYAQKVHVPKEPSRLLIVRFLVGTLVYRGKGAEAEQILREQLKTYPDSSEYWCNLVRLLASQGRIEEALAATYASEAAGLQEAYIGLNRGVLLAQLGRLGEYEKACSPLRYGGPHEAMVYFLLDWNIPDEPTVFDHVMRLELRVDDWRGVQASRALACCRVGRYEDALRYSERFVSDRDLVVTPIGLCVRAIAHGHLGQKELGLASLARADRLLQEHPIDWVLTGDYAGGFGYRAIAVILRKEAIELLKPGEK